MDAEISLTETSNSNAFAAQARALAHTPTLAEWLKYWNDSDTDFGNLSNLQHWLQRAQRASASKFDGEHENLSKHSWFPEPSILRPAQDQGERKRAKFLL